MHNYPKPSDYGSCYKPVIVIKFGRFRLFVILSHLIDTKMITLTGFHCIEMEGMMTSTQIGLGLKNIQIF